MQAALVLEMLRVLHLDWQTAGGGIARFEGVQVAYVKAAYV